MNSLQHSRFGVVTQRSPLARFFQTLLSLFQFTENVKCSQISMELISWGPDSSLERERKIRRFLHSRAVTAKKCTQKCDARANLLSCKSNAVVVAKALPWKLNALASGLLPTLKHPGPGVYSSCAYDDRVP